MGAPYMTLTLYYRIASGLLDTYGNIRLAIRPFFECIRGKASVDRKTERLVCQREESCFDIAS